MKRISFVICFALSLMTLSVLASDPSVSQVNSESLYSEASGKTNAEDWAYGYLYATARCSGKQVKVVSQVYGWCLGDYGDDDAEEKFREQYKREVLSAIRDACGTDDYTLKFYNSKWTYNKESTERQRKRELDCAICDKVVTFYCACEAYSGKCK